MDTNCDQLPAVFLSRLKDQFGEEIYQNLLTFFSLKRPTTLRANTLKISSEDLYKELTAAGVELQPVAWNPLAYVVKNMPLRELTENPLYLNGSFYVQSLSSMLPPIVLDPQPGEKVLDLTAAPGSKTTQMAAMMQNKGEIIANDVSPIRLFKLTANLRMQGVNNAFTRRGPGEYFWKKNPEFYDRVLVDVPCTMEGRIYCGDPKTYQDWSEQKIRDLSVRQQHLLRSAVTSCKVGGTIVYSTCTLAPEENEGVLNWLLEREKGTVQVETISIPGIQGMPGIGSWQGQEYDPEVKNSLRILPSGTMEGFFVAKLRKVKSNMPAPEPVRFGRNRFDRGDRRRDSRRRY